MVRGTPTDVGPHWCKHSAKPAAHRRSSHGRGPSGVGRRRVVAGSGFFVLGLFLTGFFLRGSAASAESPAAEPASGTGYVALEPARLLDTRPGMPTVDGVSAGGGMVADHGIVQLQVVGRGGVPATGVGAVVLNITTVGQTGHTFLTVWPTGTPRPLASNLNPNPGIIQPNLVVAKVGDGGQISIFNNTGDVHVIADVQGWFPAPLGTAFNPLLPARVLDSRAGQPTIDGAGSGAGSIGAGQTMSFKVTGRGGVPATGVAAVVINITATGQTAPTFLTVFPTGTTRPNSSDLNPNPAVTAANVVIARVGADGMVSIYNNSGTVDVIGDVQGWFPIGSTFTSLDAARVLDTRAGFTTIDGIAQGGGALRPASTVTVKVTGRAGVPASGVGAVVLSVIAVNQTHDTFLTVYPSSNPRPNASNLNPMPGLVAPNLVIARVGATGEVTIYNNAGTVDVIADVHGWFPSNALANDDTATIGEDSAATPIDVLANDSDPGSGTITIASATQPANGIIALTGGTNGARTGLTYTPNPNYCGTDSATYTLNGGVVAATLTVAVTCINDAPSFTKGPDQIVDVGAAAQTVTGWATALSAGPPDESTQVLDIHLSTDDDALFASLPGLTSAGDLSYEPAPGAIGTATVTITVHDNGGIANDGVDTNAQTFTINVNAPPVAAAISATTPEDQALPLALTGTDAEGNPLSFTIIGLPTHGVVTQSGPACGVTTCTTVATYTPDANSNGIDSFTYKVNDGRLDSATATVALIITPVNDPPTFTIGTDQTIREDTLPRPIPGFVTDFSAGPTDEAAQAVTFTVTNDNNALFGVQPMIEPDGTLRYSRAFDAFGAATVTVWLSDDGGSANGGVDSSEHTFTITITSVNDRPTFTPGPAPVIPENSPAQTVPNWATLISPGPANEAEQLVDFTVTPLNNESLLSVQPAVSADGTLTYTPAANQHGSATFTVTIHDNGGTANGGFDTSQHGLVITINAPTLAVGDAFSTDEDTTLSVAAPGVLANDVVDPGSTKTVVALNGSSTLTGTSLHGGSVTLGEDGSFSFTPSISQQSQRTGQSDADSFMYTLQDSAGHQSTATVDLTVFGLSDPPTASDDSYDVIGNTGLYVSGRRRPVNGAGTEADGGLVANDTSEAIRVVEPVDGASTTLGGTITIDSDGSFAYVPKTGLTGVTDTFTYRMCDASPCDANTVFNTTATVRFAITGLAWYVDNDAAGPGTGTSSDPFNTLAAAEAASSDNQTIFVFKGDGTSNGYSGGVTLKANQQLIGEARGFWIGNTEVVSVHIPANRPLLTNTAGDVITLASGSGVAGLDIDPAGTGNGISGGVGVAGGAITDVRLVDAAPFGSGAGLVLEGTTGAFTFRDITVNTTGAVGVSLTNNPLATVTATGVNTITTTTGTALKVVDTDIGLVGMEFRSISSNGAPNGIVLENTGTNGATNGGLTVTGTGTAGSGGTIESTTGADAWTEVAGLPVVTGTAGVGIFLQNTIAPTFVSMNVNGSSNAAIAGFDVARLSLTDFAIAGSNGDNAANDESAVYLYNATGRATIAESSISGGFVANLRVVNTSGILNSLTITATTFGSTGAGSKDNVSINARNAGTTFNMRMQSSTVLGAKADWLNFTTEAGAASQVLIGGDAIGDGNTFTALGADAHPSSTGGAQRVVLSDSGGIALYKIKNNIMNGSDGSALLLVSRTGGASMESIIESNKIGTSGIPNSGSSSSSGIEVDSTQGGDQIARISGNTIREYNDRAIRIEVGDTAGAEYPTAEFTVVGNDIHEPGNTDPGLSFNAINVISGTLTDDRVTMCADVGGDGSLANSLSGGGSGPTAGSNADILVGQAVNGTTIRLPGLNPPSPFDETVVEAYLSARNTAAASPSPTAFAFQNTLQVTAFTGGGAPCDQPIALAG